VFTAGLLVLIGIFGQRCASVPISSVAFRPDGQEMLVVKLDGQVERWGGWPERAEYLYKTGDTASIYTGIYTPDGKGLIGTGPYSRIYLWDFRLDKPIRQFGQTSYQGTIWTVVTDGEIAATLNNHTSNPGVNEVNLWDIDTGNLVRKFSHVGQTVGSALSPEGNYLATVSKYGAFCLWDTSNGNEILTLPLANRSELYSDQVVVAFSPDGKHISVAGKGAIKIIGLDRVSIKFENNLTETYPTQVTGLAFSPDGRTLAATFAGTGNQIYLWDAQGKLLKRMSHPGAHLTGLAFSPDGKTILTGSADGIPRLWDVETGTPQRVLCPNIISRRYSAAGWAGLFALIVVPLRAVRRFMRTC
jgi:WD40 repeat protein